MQTLSLPPPFFFLNLRRELLGHRVSILKLYKKLPIAILHCHQQCVRAPLAPDPRLTWYYQFFFSVIPTGVKWCLIMAFIYISLIINDIASFCVLICHLYNLLNEVSLQAFFPHVFIGLFVLSLSCKRSLYSLDTIPCQMYTFQILSTSLRLIFSFL